MRAAHFMMDERTMTTNGGCGNKQKRHWASCLKTVRRCTAWTVSWLLNYYLCGEFEVVFALIPQLKPLSHFVSIPWPPHWLSFIVHLCRKDEFRNYLLSIFLKTKLILWKMEGIRGSFWFQFHPALVAFQAHIIYFIMCIIVMFQLFLHIQNWFAWNM